MRNKKLVDISTLTDINNQTRNKVIEYLHSNPNETLTSFSKKCEVGQPNLYVFINGKTLAVHNIEKIWKFFESL